jgi:uncharacterized OsmC-like protein
VSNEAEIRTVANRAAQAEPPSIVLKHHRAGTAEIRVKQLTGGNLLHLALAGCVFNNVFRLARRRRIALEDVSVWADGDFTEDGSSTGIECRVRISGNADQGALRAIAQEAFDDSTVASALRRGARVTLSMQ